MAGTLPPLFPISDEDHSGYVAVTVYTLLSLTVTTVFVRLFTRWYIARDVYSDDVLLTGATGLGILQSAFVQISIDHGLGKKIRMVSTSDLTSFDKYMYGAQILLLATVACSKCSVALLFRSLTAQGNALRLSQGLMVVIGLWTSSSILALAFQCDLPHPWAMTGRCVNREALANYIWSMNILSDAALVFLPCVVLHKVQIRGLKRLRIMAMFATRLVVCVATGIQMHYVNIANSSPDRTWANINATIWAQVMMNLSIITTAIPSLGRLMIELQPSHNAFAITERHGFSGDKYAISSLSGHFVRDHTINEGLGTHSSVHGQRQAQNGDTESTEGLVGDAAGANRITKTVYFEVN
ncbi:hypothetical protein KXW28_000846 [Aspergillus fumigatus]|nr:hypothetical protein KXX30_000810 [Aspergillus fumigatus]KAH1286464.1 hypothetical protein KXX48_000431 [Aspergillus fumigatus]KAH1311174.1 hypothetical protein KXX66_008391 [Aspergillus fumigatus]KAH1377602.1 hypothetical protein KXX50_009067 [Aspergillus fumigatus]KAH1417738.1 hypothetical protein KXX22_005217 [Aspergillus fumigatus]